MASDLFTMTKNTMLRDLVLNGGPAGRDAAHHHMMEVYQQPLAKFLSATSYRSLGDPLDLVHGFFLHAIKTEDYLDRWLQSGKRLRRWLMSGLLFYAETVRRRQQRRERPLEDIEVNAGAGDMDRLERQLDRDFTCMVLKRAIGDLIDERRRAGAEADWDIFYEYAVNGRACKEIAADRGMTFHAAFNRIKVVRQKLADRVKELLVMDGVNPSEVDAEIRDLLNGLGGGSAEGLAKGVQP